MNVRFHAFFTENGPRCSMHMFRTMRYRLPALLFFFGAALPVTAQAAAVTDPVPTAAPADGELAQKDDTTTPPDAGDPANNATVKANPGNFFGRFLRAYADDWKGTSSSSETPKFRGYPAPVPGPPYPFSVWPYGGSPVIGQPWTQAGPLMTAIWGG
jgi:hypothetical protein